MDLKYRVCKYYLYAYGFFRDIGKAIECGFAGCSGRRNRRYLPDRSGSRILPAVYPLLPFTHSMAAMREAVGGVYAMDYWMDLGKLGVFLDCFTDCGTGVGDDRLFG